jgi:uncharacterized membrane protein (UPF0127 family)
VVANVLRGKTDFESPLRDRARLRAVNRSRGAVLAERAEVAASPWRRMRGLLGRSPLVAGQGLLIAPCQGIHSLGMGYPIDVVHLDRNGAVRRVLHSVPPWRLGPLVWRSRCVLELPAGAAAGTVVGDQVDLLPLPDEATST